MSRKCFNLETHGQYEYAMQIIELNNLLFNRSTEDMDRIINNSNVEHLDGRELEIYQTYVHEMTHFIDSTTTLWGMEYTTRMYRWFNEKSSKYLKVFAINDVEITMHNKLHEELFSDGLNFREIKFSLDHCDLVGIYVQFHYLSEYGSPIISTPLTIFSLFEGHAYAQEKLVSCKIFEKNGDLVSLAILERSINEQISQLKSSEYTCLLALVIQLFPNIKLSRKLEIICILSKFCFNAPTILLSTFPNDLMRMIFHGANEELISSLQMELSRGTNRSILALLLLLAMKIKTEEDNTSLDELTSDQIEPLLLNVYVTRSQSIDDVVARMKVFWEIEFDLLTSICEEVGAELALKMANQVKNMSWYNINLKDIYLPDVYLKNGDWLSSKRPLDFDIPNHYEEMIEESMSLEASLNAYGVTREHLTPSFYHGWLKHMKTENTGIYIHTEE